MLNIPQLGRIKSTDQHIHDAIKNIQTYVNGLATQLGLDGNAPIPTPPQISGISVTAANGQFRISLTDNNPNNRLLHYFVDYDTKSDFSANAITIALMTSRDIVVQLGSQTLFFRGYSQYFGSNTSPRLVFGGGNPIAVVGGGSAPAPTVPSQGSGTGPGGGGGFGGVSPIRDKNIGGGGTSGLELLP